MIVFFLQPAALLFYIVCLPLLLLYGIRLFEEKLQQILSCQFAQFFICHICPFAVLKNGYSKFMVRPWFLSSVIWLLCRNFEEMKDLEYSRAFTIDQTNWSVREALTASAGNSSSPLISESGFWGVCVPLSTYLPMKPSLQAFSMVTQLWNTALHSIRCMAASCLFLIEILAVSEAESLPDCCCNV